MSDHGSAYVVHSASGLARSLGLLAVYPLVAGVAAGLLGGHWWVGPVFLVASLVFSVSSLRSAWTRLQVDPTGIALSFPRRWQAGRNAAGGADRRYVSWAWVHRVEVAAGSDVVRVVVRADAPLPPWQHGRIVDPSDPDSGPVLEREVPGVDAAALHRAVLAVSPSTPVLTR